MFPSLEQISSNGILTKVPNRSNKTNGKFINKNELNESIGVCVCVNPIFNSKQPKKIMGNTG